MSAKDGGDVTKYHSISELEELTSVPDSTIRRYISKFSDFFIDKSGGRVKKYEETAIKVLIRIKNLFDNGYGTIEVYDILRNEFPMIVDDGNEKDWDKTQSPALATNDDIAEIKEAFQRQEKFNKLLVEKLDQQSKKLDDQERYIKEVLEKRDQVLTQTMNNLLDSKKEIAAVEEKAKRSFFSRLFKR